MRSASWRADLENLKARVENEFGADNVFFFKSVEKEGIAGYWGTGPVVFVAERPSRAPAKRRQATRLFSNRFFEVLQRHHFEDAHLTDLIKHFPATGLGHEELIRRNWPYFLEELAIVDAKIVVAVGSVVHRKLKGRISQPLYLMPHYAYRYGPVVQLRKQLDDALERVNAAREALTSDGPLA